MKARDIVALLAQGKKPMVKLVNNLWEESWGDVGMLARVTGFKEHPQDTEDMIELEFDYNECKVHNLSMQSHDYYLRGGGTGTAFESGMMKEDNIHEGVYFELPQDVPVVLADSPLMDEYFKSGSKVSYVVWLEDELTLSREAYRNAYADCVWGHK